MSNILLQSVVSNNIGLGINVFKYTTSAGINNIGIGGNIFPSNTTGKNNIGIGGNVFVANTNGQNNIGIGNDSGTNVQGSNNTMLGSNTGQSDNNIYNNSTAIGYRAIVSANNQIVIGTINDSVKIPCDNFNISGGVGIRGDMNLGGNIIVNANIYMNGSLISNNIFTPLTAGSILASTIKLTSNISSTIVSNNSIFVTGGVGIGGNISIGDNLALAIFDNFFFVVGGSGGNSIAYSNNSTSYTGIGTAIFNDSCKGIIYGPKYWVAAGSGTVHTLAYSIDGIKWTGIGTSIFSGSGNGINYGNGLWIAVGSGNNNTIAYSYDGIVWNGLGTNIFIYGGQNVAYGNGRWVAVGDGTNNIAYSDNGILWIGVTIKTIFSYSGYGIVYGNGLWVAGGIGTENTLAYSYDGINWIGNGKTIFTYGCYGVAYGIGRWTATGEGGNTIATSIDGINWSGLGTNIFTIGKNVAYGSGIWVAVGTGTNSIAYSINGTIWNGLGKNIVDNGYGVGCRTNYYTYNSNLLSLNSTNDLSIDGNSVIINSKTISTNTSTGALVINGDCGIGGNSYIGGNLIVNGNIFINSNILNAFIINNTTGIISSSISTGTITSGIITSTAHNMGTNPLSAGNISVGSITTSAIGIGTSSPSAPLQILPNNTNNPALNGIYVYNYNAGPANHAIVNVRTQGSSGNPYISWDIAGVIGWSMGIDNSDSQKLKISNNWASLTSNTKVTITTSGNFGINTTTPAYLLDVNGSINATDYYLNGLLLIPLDGRTSARAAPSAKYIQQSFGIYTNGVYWIKLPTAGAVQIYCIMETTYAGGGWMLAIKATRGTTFPYLSTYWTDRTTTLNPTQYNRNDGDAKFQTFNYFPATDWMALWPDAPVNGGDISLTSGGWSWVELNAVGSTIPVADFFARNIQITKLSNGAIYNVTTPIPKNSAKFSSNIWSSQDGFQWYGYNYTSATTPTSNNVRWGWGWNNEADQASNDIRGGIGMAALTGYSAGDHNGSGVNRSMRFEWYVR